MYQPPTPCTPAIGVGKNKKVAIKATIGVENKKAFISIRVGAGIPGDRKSAFQESRVKG